VVTFRLLVTAPVAERGPLPFFVFLGAPIGLFLGWLSFRLARERRGAGGDVGAAPGGSKP
jgi:hypothetical protein